MIARRAAPRLALLAAVSVPYRIRRSDRARRIRVSVDGNGEVEVVLPRRSPERHAEEAVRELAPWIERRRRAVARGRARRSAARRARCRTWARRCRSCPSRARARAPARRRAARPRGRRRARRSSAGTGARRASEVAPRLDAATARAPARRYTRADDPRPEDALGVVLVLGRDVVQLAAAARAAGDPRLRRRARGRPHRGDGPLAALLAAARLALAALARALGVARSATAPTLTLLSVGAAPRTRSRPRAARSRAPIRPVQATSEPSPRTSSPARTPAPLSSIRSRDQVARLVAAADEVHGVAPRRRRARARSSASSASSSDSCFSCSTFGPRRTVTR